MTSLQVAFRVVAFGWVLGLAALVVLGLLRGTINTKGLVSHKATGGTATTSAGRVQLLVVTLAGAAVYLSRVIETSGSGQLPTVPVEWIATMGASNAAFLGAKVLEIIRSGRRPF